MVEHRELAPVDDRPDVGVGSGECVAGGADEEPQVPLARVVVSLGGGYGPEEMNRYGSWLKSSQGAIGVLYSSSVTVPRLLTACQKSVSCSLSMTSSRMWSHWHELR